MAICNAGGGPATLAGPRSVREPDHAPGRVVPPHLQVQTSALVRGHQGCFTGLAGINDIVDMLHISRVYRL